MSNYAWSTLLNGQDNNVHGTIFVKDKLNNLYITGLSNSKVINIGDNTYSRNSDTDASFIVKLNEYGIPVWFHWIDGSLLDIAFSIAIDNNNDIYVGYIPDNI